MGSSCARRFTFSLFLFLLFSSSGFCREIPDAVVLDVAASIQRTLDVLSFDPQSRSSLLSQDSNATVSSSSSRPALSLELHPRHALRKPTHKNYSGLLLSRLGRDAARVGSILLRVDLAAEGVGRSELRPEGGPVSELRPESLQAPVVSGTSKGSGEYFARVGFGTPSKPMYVVPDTGSDVNWIQCLPCSSPSSCYDQADPIFDPKSSSSYARLSCGSPQCRALEVSSCRNGDVCAYQVAYGDGSYTIGEYATETLSFGPSGGNVPSVAIGCGHENQGLFVGSDGLIGLGGGPLSLTSQVKAKAFSYCFVDRDSAASSTLDFDSPRPADSITAPLMRNRRVATFFYVGLMGLSVGAEALSIPPSVFQMDAATGRGGVIVDSGTSVTRLPTQAYNSLRDAFRRMTRNLPTVPGGFAIFDTCYDLSSRTTVDVPTVALKFSGGKSLPLPAKNYLIPVDSAGTFCLAFAPTTSSMSIIGNIQQQGTRVSYDLPSMLVGFSPNKC